MDRWTTRFIGLSIALLPSSSWLPDGNQVRANEPGLAPGHPVVPGFERFHAAQPGPEGGRLLLTELNCVSCHRPEKAVESTLLGKKAPILDQVGQRLQPAYLRKYLGDPAASKPGTTMPNLFKSHPATDRTEQVEALVHFLASTGKAKVERPDRKLIKAGRDVYHKIGCVACHGTRDALASADKVFATSVPLGDLRAKYTFSGLRTFLENPHASRPAGRMPVLLKDKEAIEVTNYLLQGARVEPMDANFTYTYYEGSWDNLPDFTKLKPKATGKSAGLDLAVARRNTEFAIKFEGYLKIEQEGQFKFWLTSDDGSKVFVDGKLVVANDGIHAPSTQTAATRLAPGMHHLLVGVFNGGGGAELELELQGTGVTKQPISGLVSLTPESKPPMKNPEGPSTGDEPFQLQPALVEKGRELFGTLGCGNCHQLNLAKKPGPPASPLAALRPGAGCLEAVPHKGVPWFNLNPAQRTALDAMVKTPWPATPPVPAEVVARTFTAFNCYACHQRDKIGGPEEAVNPHFSTTQPEMGDEGRIPPILDGVGAKLTPAYLKKTLDKGIDDRPYMNTRMPGFGDANVGHLVGILGKLDSVAAAPLVKFKDPPAQVKAEARHMVGGNALGCIKCHTFAGHKAEGVQGIDMTLLFSRLQRDWFIRYLQDPNKFRPGTRMPAAWPTGISMLPKVLDGQADTQIEAIWVYLGDGKNAALPMGLKKESIPLKPSAEAIVYRNFLQGAGARGIGVGYPEKAHLAFDANDIRLALIWQGDFLDAARHWNGRGVGYEPPLGDNILSLPSGASFAVLKDRDEPWPTKSAKEHGYRFQGYRLTPDQRPTFLYAFNGVQIEDFPNAVAGKPHAALRRQLAVKSDDPIPALYFRAAVADKIEPAGPDQYRINGEWTLKVDAPATVRDSGGRKELLVPIRLEADKKSSLLLEYVW